MALDYDAIRRNVKKKLEGGTAAVEKTSSAAVGAEKKTTSPGEKGTGGIDYDAVWKRAGDSFGTVRREPAPEVETTRRRDNGKHTSLPDGWVPSWRQSDAWKEDVDTPLTLPDSVMDAIMPRTLMPELRKQYDDSVQNRIRKEENKARERQAMREAGYRDPTILDNTIGSVKRGYWNSERGKELFNVMMGGDDSRLQEIDKRLEGEEYRFVPNGTLDKALSGSMELVGQQGSQFWDPLTIGAIGGYSTMAALAGQAGPQALTPEEVVTVPSAALLGWQAGSAMANMKIEAGNSYEELLEAGVDKDTASLIAMVVGGVNGALESAQVSSLLKGFDVVKSAGSNRLTDLFLQEIKRRGTDVLDNVAQEILQEGTTIAGTQIGSKLSSGEWAYGADDVRQRLSDTALSSALTFGLSNVPGAVRNVAWNMRYRGEGVSPSDAAAGSELSKYTEAEGTDGTALLKRADGSGVDAERADGSPLLEQAALDIAQTQKTAPTGEAGRVYHGQILDSIRANIGQIQTMEPVAALTGMEFQKTAGDTRSLRVKVIDFFNSIGNKVTRGDIGEIELNTAGVRDSTAHGYGKLKAATFAALPDVLKKGKIIETRGPYEGHGYNSYFISAPVTVNGETCYVGALVIKDEKIQRYKIHEVLTTNESGTPLFKSESAGMSAVGPLRNGAPLETPEGASTDIILPQGEKDVKGQYARPGGEISTPDMGTDAAVRSQMMGRLDEALDSLGPQGAEQGKAFFDRTHQDPVQYYGGFSAYYQAGLTGRDMGQVTGEFVHSLSEPQKQAAYLAGQVDAQVSLAAEKEKVGFASVAGKDSGVVYDDYVKNALRHGQKKTYRRLNSLAKALGVRVRLVDSVWNGEANADINIHKDGTGGNEVRIEKNNPNPIRALLGHELTHRTQQLSPEAYRAFRDYVGQREETAVEVEAMMDLYRRKGMEITYEGALDEVTADYAGELFEGSEAVDRFIRENIEDRSLLEKVRDFIRDMVDKLTGKERIQATEAERKLTAALEAAVEQAGTLTTESAATESNDGRMSLKDVGGKQVVWLESSPLTNKQLGNPVAVAEYIAQHIGDVYTIIESGQSVYLGEDLPGEYTHSRYSTILKRTNNKAAKAKSKAISGLGELIETATNRRWEKTRHPESKDAKYGMYRYDSTFAFPVKDSSGVTTRVRSYDVELLIRNASDGKKYLYDIVNVKENTTVGHDLQQREARAAQRAASRGDVSMNSISQDGKDVNGKFSLKGEEELLKETRRLVRKARAEGWSDAQLRQARLEAVERVYQGLIGEYGAIPAGEAPAREIQVPKKTSDTGKVSQTVRTILEAKATPEEAIPTIQELTARGEFSYETITDKAAMERASGTITEKNWGKALSDWKREMSAGKVTKDNTALGWALYDNAANSGDLDVAMDILQEMVKNQRSAAQALQATRILKKLSPESQLYGVVQSVEGLQKELNEQYGETEAPELKISEELGEKLLAAKTQAERDAALREIYRDIGRQMPSRFRDKWNAWRYLSMLGNPRTHVRNVVGNAGFAPVVAVKDLTATAIEKAVSAVTGGNLERSKGLVGFGKKGRGLLAAAWADYANVEETALGGGKYSDFQNANKYIEEGRVIFKSKPGKVLEAARKANSRALDVEDVWFSKPHYAYAMAQFCTAHGITEAEIRRGNDQVLAAARNYAVREAQKATYRDTNALSQTVGRLGRDITGGKNPVSRSLGTLAEGILPFRKTPANILARGLEYSPLGLMKGLSYDLAQVKKGSMTGAEAIDNISAGLTGTGLLALGVYLASMGLVRGRGEGDDKERELEELQGHQDYSMELPDGTSVTLDWLAPEALPFFVGVNLWEVARSGGGNVTLSQMLEAVGNVSEPMLEMSCLQSLNDVLEAGSRVGSQGLGALPSALTSAATSYLTQALPTLFGQLERTAEGERESTYTEKNAFLTSDIQYTLGKISGKIPAWEYQQIPYIDAWGRHESSGGVGQRAFNNLLNPAYTSRIEESPMEQELLRLYRETDEAGVLPKRAGKYFNVNGERRDLTGAEYVRYAEAKGKTSLELVTALTESKLYSGLEDGVKAEAVKDAYTYANQIARSAIDSGAAVDSWVSKAREGEKKYKLPVSTYILLRNITQDIEGLKDGNGETIANSKGLRIMQRIYGVKGLNDGQREYLFDAFGVGKTVRNYNKAAVDGALDRMNGK